MLKTDTGKGIGFIKNMSGRINIDSNVKLFDKYEQSCRMRILSALKDSECENNFIDMEAFAFELTARAFNAGDVFRIVKELVIYMAENHPEKLVKDILYNVYPEIVFLCDEKDVKEFNTPRYGEI